MNAERARQSAPRGKWRLASDRPAPPDTKRLRHVLSGAKQRPASRRGRMWFGQQICSLVSLSQHATAAQLLRSRTDFRFSGRLRRLLNQFKRLLAFIRTPRAGRIHPQF